MRLEDHSAVCHVSVHRGQRSEVRGRRHQFLSVLVSTQALNFKKYSAASDVWSYGALMYEIWSLGHKPFEGYTNAQVRWS